mgnify:CR=1 FL=1
MEKLSGKKITFRKNGRQKKKIWLDMKEKKCLSLLLKKIEKMTGKTFNFNKKGRPKKKINVEAWR